MQLGLRWSYDPDGCCEIRKVRPNFKALQDTTVWLTGLRHDQSSFRRETPKVQLVEIPPYQVIPDHVHDSSREVYAVLSGQCLLTVDSSEYRLQPGDIIFMEPGDTHRLHNDGDEPFLLLVFKTCAETADTFWLDA